MPWTRAIGIAFALGLPAASSGQAEDATQFVGDPERGKIVFRTVGGCVNCHGWAADGKTGVNMRAPVGASLRDTGLDRIGLMEVIRCGRPGTAMPFHDKAAYRDDRCYGMVKADFDPGTAPVRGKTFSDQDAANIVAYLQDRVIGLGKPTYAECADFFDDPDASACDTLK